MLVLFAAVSVSLFASSDVISSCEPAVVEPALASLSELPYPDEQLVVISVPTYRMDCRGNNGCPAKYDWKQVHLRVESTDGKLTIDGVPVGPDGTFVIEKTSRFQRSDTTWYTSTERIEGRVDGYGIVVTTFGRSETSSARDWNTGKDVVLSRTTWEGTGSGSGVIDPNRR